MLNKTTILVFILITLLSVILLLQIRKDSAGQNKTKNLIITLPPQATLGVTENLNINLPEPIVMSTLKYEVKPETQVIVSQNNSTLIIEPVQSWKFNTKYEFKILKGLRGISGSLLDIDAMILFETETYSGI